MNASFERSPQSYLRLAGIFYLLIILLGLYGEAYVRATLVVSGDPTATANAISAAQLLWRSGIAGDLLMHILDIPVIVVLYLLLKPVSEGLALCATFINLIQTAVLAANKLNLLLPLFVLGNAGYLKTFTPDQLHTLSYLAIKAHGYGFAIGLIFFGVSCLIRGYLIVKADYMPRIFGFLMIFAGLSYLINSFALLLAPSVAAALSPAILIPAFVGELALSLWMVARGVKLPQWHQRISGTSSR